MKPATVLKNLSTWADSEEIESHYAAGSEAKFNLWLAGDAHRLHTSLSEVKHCVHRRGPAGCGKHEVM